MIQSHEIPERMVEINGVRKYRINVQEVVREDNIVYTYDEVEFNAVIPVEVTDRKVSKLKIRLALESGDIEKAKNAVTEELLRQEFEAKLRAEYDELFPAYTEEIFSVVFDDMHLEIDGWKKEKSEVLIIKEDYESNSVEYRMPVEYENNIAFEQYKNETRVVSEAIEATYDEDGIELTQAVAEVTELVRPYIAKDVTDRVDEYLKSKYAELRAKAYPPMAMFADAWVKNDTEAMEEYRRLCLEVKERFPK